MKIILIIGAIISASLGAVSQRVYDKSHVLSCSYFSHAGSTEDAIFMLVKCKTPEAAVDLRLGQK